MDQKRKTIALRAAAAVAGVTAAVFVGMMYPTENRSASVDVTSSRQSEVSALAASADKAGEPKEEKLPEFIEYRKADIREYKMASVSSTPLVPLSSKEVTEKDEESSEADKSEEEQEEAKAEAEDFTVVIPEDGTEVYDSRPAPQYYSTTRSVANEYYTVNDLISGGKVTMNAHEMLCRMVFNEIGALWDEEAIKAQVVAAYTHLRYNDLTGRIPTIALKPGYPDKIERCVSAVEGQAVFYNGNIINATYAASTAGYSADSGEIFGISYPYLKPVVSEYDSEDPNWGTVTQISPDTIRKAFMDKYSLELSEDYKSWFEIKSMHAGRYVGNVYIDGGRMSLSGAEMRTLLKLKSSAFEISYSGGMFTFTTYGYGHGVGMSQWGAKLYADHGWTYDQILRHYYLDTTVSITSENSNAVERGRQVTTAASRDESSAAERDDAPKEKAPEESSSAADSEIAAEQTEPRPETADDTSSAE